MMVNQVVLVGTVKDKPNYPDQYKKDPSERYGYFILEIENSKKDLGDTHDYDYITIKGTEKLVKDAFKYLKPGAHCGVKGHLVQFLEDPKPGDPYMPPEPCQVFADKVTFVSPPQDE